MIEDLIEVGICVTMALLGAFFVYSIDQYVDIRMYSWVKHQEEWLR